MLTGRREIPQNVTPALGRVLDSGVNWSKQLSLVPWKGSSLTLGDVQVRASQGRRGRDTGSYRDRGERREVRARAPRSVKRFPFQGTRVRFGG